MMLRLNFHIDESIFFSKISLLYERETTQRISQNKGCIETQL
jgi:hypothetical protein